MPGSQYDVSIVQRQALAGRKQEMLAMGVAIARFVGRDIDAARHIVVVVHIGRHEPVQHPPEVSQKQRLTLIDADGGGGV